MNQEKAPAFYYEPLVLYLYQVLDELGNGALRIPEFQRPFVWEDEDRIQLLESIRDGLPVGALLLWRTQRAAVRVESELAGLEIPNNDQALRQYLLDGKQRMTTLFGALKTNGGWAIRYDLKEEQFLVGPLPANEQMSLVEHGRYMPMSSVLDSVALVRFQRSIRADNEAEAEIWVRRSDDIAKAFREYKLSIIVVATDDVAAATKTFQRVNSLGQRLTETHMVNALAWSPEFSLVSQLDQIIENNLEPLGWGEIDETLVFRSIKVAIGLDAYDDNPDRIAAALGKRRSAVDEVAKAFELAIAFLRQTLGITRPARLPYAHQLQMLVEVLRLQPDVTQAQAHRLGSWFWVTTLDETFSQPGGRLVAKMFTYVRELLGENIPSWPARRLPQLAKPPARFDARHARARGIMLLMARPNDDPYRLFGRRELSSRALYDSPANRILCTSADEAANLGGALHNALAPQAAIPEILAGQCFPDEAFRAATEGRLEDCINVREHELAAFEQRIFAAAMAGLGLDVGADEAS